MTKKTSKPRGKKTHKADQYVNRAHEPTELERNAGRTVREESENRDVGEDSRPDSRQQ